mmetsp:Transcript_3749/g.13546  ORF Transcript_3749/g.13546 Transcript_3749/m.13546 type:complete len:206 (+) Transcript_3749:729-1346(+)
MVTTASSMSASHSHLDIWHSEQEAATWPPCSARSLSRYSASTFLSHQRLITCPPSLLAYSAQSSSLPATALASPWTASAGSAYAVQMNSRASTMPPCRSRASENASGALCVRDSRQSNARILVASRFSRWPWLRAWAGREKSRARPLAVTPPSEPEPSPEPDADLGVFALSAEEMASRTAALWASRSRCDRPGPRRDAESSARWA